MAKKQEDAPPNKRDAPPKVVESEEDSEEDDDDDGVMADEFQGVGEEVESGDEDGVGFESESESESEAEEVVEILEGPRRLLGRIMDAGGCGDSEDSMEGSRSRSEEDLRDIGSARRLDDDDTGDSAWKEAAGPSSSSVAEKEKSDGDVAVARVLEEEEEVEEKGGEGVGAMETDEEEEEEEDEEEEEEDEEDEEDVNEAESQSEGEPSASVSVEDGSDSDSGKGDKGDGEQPTAYSRAFSKILQQSKAAKESDTGPVLAARQTLVARKLEEEAGETKENKDTRKEKKELREKAHMYPQSYTDTKEKDLVKLATRGVVKLFNAVSKAQKVQASADGRDAKVVAKQSKSVFLAEVRGTGSSVAVGSKRSHSSTSAPPFKFGASESQNQPTSRWSVVKDDFMLGKQKLKDWDKDEEMRDAAGVQQLNNGIDDDSD